MMAKLAKKLNESNINVILTQSASMMNLTSGLRTLQVRSSFLFVDSFRHGCLFKEKKARIVFVNFEPSTRSQFFCEVYRTFSKDLRERYVWILTGRDHLWWDSHQSNCTRKEILLAARNHLIVDSSYEQRPSFINTRMVRFEKREEKKNKSKNLRFRTSKNFKRN